jgi:hypothetical protein
MAMRTISETDVQAAIAALVESDSHVRHSLLRHIVGPTLRNSAADVTAHARQSVVGHKGETDILIDYQIENRGLRVLTEVKLEAAFQPTQGARYGARAEAERSDGRNCITLLVAPAVYLAAPNPEARKFQSTLSLEELLTWARPDTAHAQLIAEACRRIASGNALGAKGLFLGLYTAVANECEQRGSSLRILNRPTEWMSLKHPALPTGVNLNYRIRSAVAELRVLASYRGPRDCFQSAPEGLSYVQSGGELFMKLPTLPVTTARRAGEPSMSDVQTIVDAFDQLVAHWVKITTPTASIGA